MRILYKNNRLIFYGLGFFFLLGFIAIFTVSKSDLHLLFNNLVSDSFNPIFKLITYIGDGWFIIGFLIIALFINLRFFFTAGISYGVSSGVTQIIKNFFFKGELRPKPYFEQFFPNEHLKLLKGIEVFGENSFPSGHTTAAFSFFICLGLILRYDWIKILCFVIAILVGVSRIYLSQHFFQDVLAGAFIGSASAIIFVYYFNYSVTSGRFNRLDQPLLRYLFSKPYNE